MRYGGTDEAFTFRCPTCEESLEVNGPMKEALEEKGCVVCGSSVTAAAFTSVEPTDPR
jgi:hypothetical protein